MMRRLARCHVATCMAFLAWAPVAGAQDGAARGDSTRADSAATPPLFAATRPLALTFTANLRRLRADRDSNAPWRAMTIAYSADGKDVVVPGRTRTRGIWRLKNCSMPPLRLNFSSKDTKGTLLRHLGRPKLVNHCKDRDDYEQYILQEAQLYRVYRLLTTASYRTRLVKVAYVDSASHSVDATRYAIIVEDPDEMAKRLDGQIMKAEGATAADFDAEPLALAYLFQFMIGNLDFSFNRLHNTNLVATSNGRLLPVVYDFDYTGAVNAVYARPDPRFGQKTVRDRRFRGYCSLDAAYPAALKRFQDRKADIYALYHDEIGQLLRPDVVRETLAYFDEFYERIATPDAVRRYLLDDCVGPH